MTTGANDSPKDGNQGLEELAWREISRPGCYVFVDSGDLVRLPAEGLTTAAAPVISIVSRTPRLLARVSNDPVEALPVLRALAWENGYPVNF